MPNLRRSATKNIDQETKCLVFGFLREVQELSKNEKDHSYQIPLVITHLCLLYYYLPEHFARSGHHIKVLNKARNKIQNQLQKNREYEPDCLTAYGDINIYGRSNSLFVW
eukprot:890678_1